MELGERIIVSDTDPYRLTFYTVATMRKKIKKGNNFGEEEGGGKVYFHTTLLAHKSSLFHHNINLYHLTICPLQ